MALNCGTNLSLDGLNDVRDEIKNALTQGKDALADLQSKVSEATAQFEGLKAEIEENVSSFQEDLQALSTKFGEEFAAAQNDLREKWGDVVDDIEGTLATIPSIDDIISGQASLPDLCKEVENIAVKINEDGTKEKIVKAAAAIKPNVKPIEVPKFEPIVVDRSTQPSTANPYTNVAYSYLTEVTVKHFDVRNEIIRVNYSAPYDELKLLLTEGRQDPLYKSIKKKMKDSGLKGGQLQKQGLLTQEENKFRTDLIRDVLEPLDVLKYSWTKIATANSVYEDVVGLGSNASQKEIDDWAFVYNFLRNEDPKITPTDIAILDQLVALADANAELLIGWYNYTNRV